MNFFFLVAILFALSGPLWGQCVSGNCKSGNGTFIASGGAKYVGQFKNGKLHGHGIYTNAGGVTYVGQFTNDELTGTGTYTWPTGEKYVGTLLGGKLHGRGAFTFSDGKKYAGQFSYGDISGSGVMTWVDGRKYVGRFKKGEFYGQGTFTWPTGEKYVGNFIRNLRDGKGTLSRPDGSTYIGYFKEDIPVNEQGVDYLFDGRRLVYLEGRTELRDSSGRLLDTSLTNWELDAIRNESAVKKRQVDEQLVRQEKADALRNAEQQRHKKKLIVSIQKILIDNLYLNGPADGIAGKNTLAALMELYDDAGLNPPDLTSFDKIFEVVSSRYLEIDKDCISYGVENYTACFTLSDVRPST
jgi:hypothetical protein